jgi:ribosomal protein L40E
MALLSSARHLSAMNKKCPRCNLPNFASAETCKRCEFSLLRLKTAATDGEKPKTSLATKILRRAAVCVVVCFLTLLVFYLSLIMSATRLSYNEKKRVESAIQLLQDKEFSKEAFLLRYLTAYRADDNWLNASTRLEDAYAATNFPFEIMTIYPDFFSYSTDDTDSAAILLHEAQHLQGKDEKEAYEFVWKNRRKLGWTYETHANSKVWENTRRQTMEICPELFQCKDKPGGDCTE